MKIQKNGHGVVTGLAMRSADSGHGHLRDCAMRVRDTSSSSGFLSMKEDWRFPHVTKYTCMTYERYVCMGNTTIPIINAERGLLYRKEIRKRADLEGFTNKTPLMVLYLGQHTTPQMIHEWADTFGYLLVKSMPRKKDGGGLSTGSDSAVYDLCHPGLIPTIRAIAERNGVLMIHAEATGEMEDRLREPACRPTIRKLFELVPDIRITVEHVSTKAMIDFGLGYPADQFGFGVDPHHALLSFEGPERHSRHRCKPVINGPEDQEAVLWLATEDLPNVWDGNDVAWHDKFEFPDAFGISYTDEMLPIWVDTFEKAGKLEQVEAFASENFANFMRLPLNEGTMEFVREKWVVPEVVEFPGGHRIQPGFGGHELNWRLAGR